MEVFNNFVAATNGNAIAEELGLGFIAKNAALNSAMNLGIKALQIVFTLFLCWLMIRLSHKLINKVLEAQVQRQKLAMSERKANTLSTVAGSILKYVIYFIGLVSVLKQLGVPTESLLVIASAGSVAIGLVPRASQAI